MRGILIGSGIAAVIAAAIFLLTDIRAVDQVYIEQAAKRAENHQKSADDRISQYCLRLTPIEADRCVNQARNAADQKAYEERNLGEQRSIAWWTEWMGIAAVLGVTTGLVGTFLLMGTLWQNLRQTELAGAVFETETRPIMVPDGIEAKEISPDLWTFAFRWKNIGKLPASIEFEETRKFVGSYGTFDDDLKRALAEPAALDGDEWTYRTVVLPSKTFNSREYTYSLEDPGDGVFAYAIIRYRSAVAKVGSTWTTEVNGALEASYRVGKPPAPGFYTAHDLAEGIDGLTFAPLRDGIKMT